jgi:hypothetical protein
MFEINPITLTTATKIALPNSMGRWDIDISNITFSSGTLQFSSGTGVWPATPISALTNANELLMVATFSNNKISGNL